MLTQEETDSIFHNVIDMSERYESLAGSLDTLHLIDFDIEYVSLDILELHRSIISGGPIPTIWRTNGPE